MPIRSFAHSMGGKELRPENGGLALERNDTNLMTSSRYGAWVARTRRNFRPVGPGSTVNSTNSVARRSVTTILHAAKLRVGGNRSVDSGLLSTDFLNQ
jgi:hypothetical protein